MFAWTVDYPGSLHCWVAAGHGGNEHVGPAVGSAGGAGDVGFAIDAVPADGGVAEDCGTVAGPGLVGVLAKGDVADVLRGSRARDST
jgi:hypothetical protein